MSVLSILRNHRSSFFNRARRLLRACETAVPDHRSVALEPLEERRLLSLLVDFRVADPSYLTDTNPSTLEFIDPHNIKVTGTGGTIKFDVWTRPQGADAIYTNDGDVSLWGAIITPGAAVKGDLNNNPASGFGPQTPFTALGSQAGTLADFDGDGDLDVGNATDHRTGVYARSYPAQYTNDSVREFKVMTFAMTIESVDSGSTSITLHEYAYSILFPGGTWIEDGRGKTQRNGTVLVTPITLQGPPNYPPYAVTDTAVTDEDTPVSIPVLTNDTDANGDTLTITAVTAGAHGTTAIDGSSVIYTPAPDYSGPDVFTYTIADGHGATSSATVNVAVTPVNDAPVANPLSVEVAEDGEVAVLLSASDVETAPDALVYTITSLPQRGVLLYQGTEVAIGQTFLGSTEGLVYTPGLAVDGAGLDGLTFVVTDTGDGDSAALTSDPAMVGVTIHNAVEEGAVTIDPCGVVRIGGTSGNDNIVVSAVDGLLDVTIGCAVLGGSIPMSAVTDVRVWGRGGDDTIDLSGISIGSVVQAGAGNDSVTGGSGDDLMLGGGGNDTLTGASGNDFLIGGDGFDRVVGSAGNDILTAGEIAATFDLNALRGTLQAWADSHAAVIDDGTSTDDVVTDGDYDVLTGSSGADWFIISAGDKITDLKLISNGDSDLVTYM